MKAINQSFIKRRKNWTTIIKEDRWDYKLIMQMDKLTLFYLYFEMKALLANNLTASIAFTKNINAFQPTLIIFSSANKIPLRY